MSLFEPHTPAVLPSPPLAQRMRPRTVEEFQGQRHLLAKGKPLERLLSDGRPTSMVFWGPPGTGKTTLARLLAGSWQDHFVEFSAVLSGVADVRRVVEEARVHLRQGEATLLFVDEIHRFNKAQQDAFLPHVEAGLITLLGATTENPSFEIIAPLLSRLRVLVLNPLSRGDLEAILDRALEDGERGLGEEVISLGAEARAHLLATSFGDARRLLTSLETAAQTAPLGPGRGKTISLALVEESVGKRALLYDKAGEEHYNLISALHKSLRGSDPDASLYWLARMLEAGEDPRYILRRMLRFASEDVGLADPHALNQVAAAFSSYEVQGMPEGALALAQAAVYLALAPKSNALYRAYGGATKDARQKGPLDVPLCIRNASTELMKSLDYGKDYLYPHDLPEAVASQEYLPAGLEGRRYYRPTDRGGEKALQERLRRTAELKGRLARDAKS